MSEYRRAYVPGGTYFFTLKTENNFPIFADAHAVSLLGKIIREAQLKWPFNVIAIVLLPDHLHLLISLPREDARYSARIGWIKKEFTKQFLISGGVEQKVSESKIRQRMRGIWQRRFWEHTIIDEADYEAHFNYIHWNPVKHGYVPCAKDWAHSSFHRWVKQGVYPEHWGCGGVAISFHEPTDTGE